MKILINLWIIAGFDDPGGVFTGADIWLHHPQIRPRVHRSTETLLPCLWGELALSGCVTFIRIKAFRFLAAVREYNSNAKSAIIDSRWAFVGDRKKRRPAWNYEHTVELKEVTRHCEKLSSGGNEWIVSAQLQLFLPLGKEIRKQREMFRLLFSGLQPRPKWRSKKAHRCCQHWKELEVSAFLVVHISNVHIFNAHAMGLERAQGQRCLWRLCHQGDCSYWHTFSVIH